MLDHFQSLTQSMGTTPSFDGVPAQVIHLSNRHGMTISLMDIGATWLSCTLPIEGTHREVLLRAKNMAEHQRQGAYFGAIVGRYANRIAQGRFELDGQVHQLAQNNGVNALHGGELGFDKRRWTILEQTANGVVFGLISKEGDQGYPGALSVRVSYQLTNDNQVQIAYWAQTTKATPCNLTNHAYFNLSGAETLVKTALDHQLQMEAPHYLPIDETSIPLGDLAEVKGTGFDFTSARSINQDFLKDDNQQSACGYDHCFVFDADRDPALPVLTLIDSQHQVTMTMCTTQPGVQFYSGNFLSGNIGLDGEYQNHQGLAFETQAFPDGPNHSEWGAASGILRPEKTYQHQTTYQFFL